MDLNTCNYWSLSNGKN